ncbi:uncharacterized protein [Choristoneura fumiferana]|uniref:uncharacterized protein n=1 Tax=Choristoneura fumiferana TaxID=7141 RepID=UPI003D15BAA9
MPAEETLKKVLNSIVEKKFPHNSKVEVRPITTPGANYTSALFAATITTHEEKVELFAKVATIGINLGANQIFQIEDYVYTQLASVFEQLQDKHGVTDRFVFSKYYGCSGADGTQTIVMENLVSRGYDVPDRFKYIDWEYASKSVEVLAKFHALSLAFCKERPEEFLKVDKALMSPPWTDGEQWQGLIDGALAVVDDEDREAVARHLDCVGWSKMLQFSKARKTAVIVHADYRPSNLMHRELDGKVDVIPVDYQTVRFGSPVSDLIYFIIMGSDEQFREQHYRRLVDHYYQQLTLALARLGIEAEDLYGREEFETDLKEKLPYGVYIGAMALPFVTIAPEEAPSFELGQFVPRHTELFAERFRALVADYKRWGII